MIAGDIVGVDFDGMGYGRVGRVDSCRVFCGLGCRFFVKWTV